MKKKTKELISLVLTFVVLALLICSVVFAISKDYQTAFHSVTTAYALNLAVERIDKNIKKSEAQNEKADG